jgi:hypothetical protein
MKFLLSLSLAVAFGFACVGCKPSEQAIAEKKASDDAAKALEGKWKIVTREGQLSEDDDGTEKPPADETYFYVIENGVLLEEIKLKDGTVEVLSRRKLVLHPEKSPMTADLIYVDEKGAEIRERTTKRGITGKKKTSTSTLKDVDGNKLEFCISFDEKNRPTDLTAPAKSSRYLVKLERMGDAKMTEKKEEKNDEKKAPEMKDEKKDTKAPEKK